MTRRSIRQKLILISMCTTTAALLLACVLFLCYDYVTFRDSDLQALDTLATTVGAGSAAAVSFQDPTSAREALEALAGHKNVLWARVHTLDGAEFVTYARAGVAPGPAQALPAPGSYFDWDAIDVVQPITGGGERVGTIVLHASRDAQRARMNRFGLTAAAIIVTAWAVGFLITSRLQALVSGPVLRLADAASRVSRNRDYGIRVARTSDDEVGALVTSFNEMLAQIQRQDSDLRRHQETLEAQVASRTVELTAVNADLAASRDRAEQASRAKSEFLANMSHEIRTPMNGVLGMIDLTLDAQLPAAQREQLEVARASAESLVTLVNDILDLSKIEAGRLELDETAFDLREAVEDAVRTVAVGARMKELALECRVDDGGAPQVRGDRGRLRQVLINLVGNAIKFTDEGRVEIDVRAVWQADGQGVLHGAVRDTGVGIPADKQALIFEAFSQADGSTTRRYGGTGLGLTISARLVALMSGDLRVESSEGDGSTFSFTARIGRAGLPARGAAATRVDGASPPPQRLKVLVVEDHPVNQRVARGLLVKAGHDVHIANDGQEALTALTQQTYDLLFMDMQMPIMSGLDAMSAIRSRERESGGHLPIIALTAHAIDGDRERFMAAGADGYVSKPIAQSVLLLEIDRVMRSTAAARPSVIRSA